MLSNIISCSAGAISRNTPMEDCIDMLYQAGYRAVDFWLWKYSAADGPMRRDDWRDWVQYVRRLFDERSITVGQVHALWDHPDEIAEDLTYKLPGEIFHRSIEACSMLGSKRLIFHPLERWYRNNETQRQAVLDANVAWFSALLPTAEKFQVELHIENLFDHKHVMQPGDAPFPCASAEDILSVIARINHPLMKTCLDTGHANINALDIPAMIRLYGDKLGSLHLNDNYGRIGPIYEDIHLCPGNGRIPWPEIFAALRDIGYTDTLNLEVNAELPKLPAPIRLIHFTANREILAHMREIYGQ